MKLSLKTGSSSFETECCINSGSDRQVKLWCTPEEPASTSTPFKLMPWGLQLCVWIVFFFFLFFFFFFPLQPQHRAKNHLGYFTYTVKSNTGICHGRTIRAASVSPHFPAAACTLSLWAAACAFRSAESNSVYLFPLYPANAIICSSNEISQTFQSPIGKTAFVNVKRSCYSNRFVEATMRHCRFHIRYS